MREALGKARLKRVYGALARRYDVQRGLITFGTDQKGRRLLVESAVRPGETVLDCGSGTGRTGLMAARKVGPQGRVTLFDLSDDMLAVARRKAAEAGLADRLRFETGDMAALPFADASFDTVLSTYSLCPLTDPVRGARELYRVTRPGGRLAVGHSVEPAGPVARWLGEKVENLAWRMPWLSMGCRAVEVLPALVEAGGKLVFERRIGVPLWPFAVFVVEKPAA